MNILRAVLLVSVLTSLRVVLPSVRIFKTKDTDGFAHWKRTHVLGCEENKLSVALTSSYLQHHVHRYPPVHHVHVNIKLVKAAKRGLRDGPEREHKANSGEGALASRQRAHVTQISFVSLAWLHRDG